MSTPPGWYPNPVPSEAQKGALRYWDGAAWTDHFHDPVQPPPPTALRARADSMGLQFLHSTFAGLGQPCEDPMDEKWQKGVDQGVLSVVAERNGHRSIVFEPDHKPGSAMRFDPEEIPWVVQVSPGLNTMVNVVFGTSAETAQMFSLTTADADMTKIFDLVGLEILSHPPTG